MATSKFGEWVSVDGGWTLMYGPEALAAVVPVRGSWRYIIGTEKGEYPFFLPEDCMRAVEMVLNERSIQSRLYSQMILPEYVTPDAVAAMVVVAHVGTGVDRKDGRPIDWAAYALEVNRGTMPTLGDVLSRGEKISEDTAEHLFPVLANACHYYRK